MHLDRVRFMVIATATLLGCTRSNGGSPSSDVGITAPTNPPDVTSDG